MKSGDRIPIFGPDRTPEENRSMKLVQSKCDANTIDPVSFQPLGRTKTWDTHGFYHRLPFLSARILPLSCRFLFICFQVLVFPMELQLKFVQLNACAFQWYKSLSSSFPAKQSGFLKAYGDGKWYLKWLALCCSVMSLPVCEPYLNWYFCFPHAALHCAM